MNDLWSLLIDAQNSQNGIVNWLWIQPRSLLNTKKEEYNQKKKELEELKIKMLNLENTILEINKHREGRKEKKQKSKHHEKHEKNKKQHSWIPSNVKTISLEFLLSTPTLLPISLRIPRRLRYLKRQYILWFSLICSGWKISNIFVYVKRSALFESANNLVKKYSNTSGLRSMSM